MKNNYFFLLNLNLLSDYSDSKNLDDLLIMHNWVLLTYNPKMNDGFSWTGFK